MKIKSNYLEVKHNLTTNEFRNIIIDKLKEKNVYGVKTRVCKFQLIVNDTRISYRQLETKTFDEIIEFYIDEIKEKIGKEEI